RETPICLVRRYESVSPLALENIERMAPSSIGCSLKKLDLSDTGLINILPKLRIHEDSEVEEFKLAASKEEYITEILEQEKTICVGRVETMELKEYAVSVITKMRLEDCGVGDLSLIATRKEHITEILKQEKPFCVGRVTRVHFYKYAVGSITEMSREDCEVEYLSLNASKEEYITEILKQEKPFCVGRVKTMELGDYAVGVIAKMSLEDCGVEYLRLSASKEEHVAAVLKQEKPFCVGRVKKMWLLGYAVGVITKMSLEDCGVEHLVLAAYKKEEIASVLEQEKPFCVGRVKTMELGYYAVGAITRISLKDCEIEYLSLIASEEAHVAEVLKQENPFCVGRVKNMRFEEYAVGVITKMSLKDCEIGRLVLDATGREHVAEVLKQEKPFCVGRVKKMKLTGYAASVITKMTIHEDNTMAEFDLRGREDHLCRILKEGDNSINLGRIRTGGLRVPEEIKRKLRYTLVDGEGREVLEEENDEEERF
ncbi:MAG: uncharacterized protein A8A55_2978, partial [Amphiamblys sp. WSBS2006]